MRQVSRVFIAKGATVCIIIILETHCPSPIKQGIAFLGGALHPFNSKYEYQLDCRALQNNDASQAVDRQL
jgi:hypothetical protein